MKTKGFRAFTPTPICVVGEQVKNMQKQIYREISNSLALYKLVRGFTLPELLTAVAIIAILIGVLMPALSQVKRIAKETRQKAQIGSIEMAINIYKNDFGAYPPSRGYTSSGMLAPDDYGYCGAQTLAEAMFGQDLLGVHLDSIFRVNGQDKYNTQLYNLTIPSTNPAFVANLNARKGPYLDRANISVFDPCQIFGPGASFNVAKDRYVICDVFTAVNRPIGGKNYKIGTPILYFRANPDANYASLTIPANGPANINNIYNYMDNHWLMDIKSVADRKDHPLWSSTALGNKFYDYIQDPLVLNLKRPVRPDSFILISAGNDGLYGTKDDICNFDPNLP